MRRVLADLHAAGVLGLDTLDAWSYDNTDVTKDKVRLFRRMAPRVAQPALCAPALRRRPSSLLCPRPAWRKGLHTG